MVRGTVGIADTSDTSRILEHAEIKRAKEDYDDDDDDGVDSNSTVIVAPTQP
jgi:hypothetical protein